MSLPTKSDIDKYQINTTNNTIPNNQSDFITLNIYNDQKIKNEGSEVNINDTQSTPINNTNNNYISKKSVMLPQNNYLYLDNIRGNNYPLSDNFRNQIYPNYNLNAYNQYGYNGQYNPMVNMNNNSPNGNPVKIADSDIPTNIENLPDKNNKTCCKRPIFPLIAIVLFFIIVIIGIIIISNI